MRGLFQVQLILKAGDGEALDEALRGAAIRNAQTIVSTPVASVATLPNSCTEFRGTRESSNSLWLMLPARKSDASVAMLDDRNAAIKPVIAAIATETTIDPENPWLGLSSYSEETRAYFHGRDEEAAELARRVQRKLLTVLFGQSGLGKTSLLRAGLVPRLRGSGFCPVYVRIDYAAESPSPAEQIKQAIFKVTAEAGHWTRAGSAGLDCAGIGLEHANLRAEAFGKPFDVLASEADAAWEEALGVIRIEGHVGADHDQGILGGGLPAEADGRYGDVGKDPLQGACIPVCFKPPDSLSPD